MTVTKLGRMIMNKIVYGIGLLLTGICGMSGIGIISELQASAFPNFKLFQKIFEANLILPFGLFLVLAVIGFIISTKAYLTSTDVETKADS